MRAAGTLLLLILISCTLCEGAIGSSSRFLTATEPLLLAHRGSKLICGENTLECYQTVLALGADVVEFDVRLTSDDQLVVFHDERVGRLTDRSERVRELPLVDLQRLDVGFRFSEDGNLAFPFRARGLRMPSLRQVLRALLPWRRPGRAPPLVNIEIKDDAPLGFHAADRLLEELEEAAAELGAHEAVFERVLLASQWCSVLRHLRARAAARGPPLASVPTSACELEVSTFYLLARLGLALPYHLVFGPPDFVALQIPTRSGPWVLAEEWLVAAARAQGVRVMFWVVNEPAEAARLRAIGAAARITDRTDLLAPLFGRAAPLAGGPLPWYRNATQRPGEVHTCITLLCKTLSLPGAAPALAILLLLSLLLCAFLCVRCCCRCAARLSPKRKRA